MALVVGVLGAVLAGGACSDDRGAGDPEAFCDAAEDSDRFEAIVADLDPGDVDEATGTFREARDVMEDLHADAPDAVRSDVGVLVRFFDDLLDGLASPEAADAERPPIYDELRPRFDQVEAASERIELYVSTNC